MAFTQKVADDKHPKLLDTPKFPSTTTRYSTLKQRFTKAPLTTKIIILWLSLLGLLSIYATLFLYRGRTIVCRWPKVETQRLSEQRVRWRSCGEDIKGYDCTNITVPLDYDSWKDEPYVDPRKTMAIAVTRFKATDSENRYVILGP